MTSFAASPEGDVRLRSVSEDDLPIFYEQQRDPDATRMAAFPAREWDAFNAHWSKILANDSVAARTVICAGAVAGNVVSWNDDGQWLVGYWIGKRYWGRGIATQALCLFLDEVTMRPMFAFVARHNVGSIRVLEKCGFTLDAARTQALTPHAEDGVTESVYVYR